MKKGLPGVRLSVRTRSQGRLDSGSSESPDASDSEWDQLAQGVKLETVEEGESESVCSSNLEEEDAVVIPESSSHNNSVISLSRQESVENSSDSEPEATNMAEARAPIVVPSKFTGHPSGDNVEEYLTKFERAARANGWDDRRKVVLIPCYLEGAALKWFENLEQRLGDAMTWAQVKAEIKEAFQTIAWDEQLEYSLRMRMQSEDEPVESYLQDVTNLCVKVDPEMSERSKIKHVLRGLKPSLLEKVMVMENDTLEHLRANIRKVQTARFMAGQRVDRLMAEPYTRGSKQSTMTSAPQIPVNSLESKIENLTSEFAKFSMHMMEQRRRNGEVSNEGGRRGQMESPVHRGRFLHRGTNRGRTADGRVICYKCNRVGHFAINCRSGQGRGSGNEQGGR